jgi:hypothetical protein
VLRICGEQLGGSCPPQTELSSAALGAGLAAYWTQLGSAAKVAGQPRPTNGIFVAITVMNCTLASSGSEAM